MPPTILLNSLAQVRRRAKVLGVLFGAGVTVVSLCGLLLATVLLDYALRLPAWPRLLVMLAAAGALGYVAWNWLLRPAMARLTLGDVAGKLEEAFPQFDDRLRSTVDFVHDDQPGSEMMKQRTVADATHLAQKLDLSKAVVVQPVLASWAGAIGALVVLVLLSLVSGEYGKTAIAHLLRPFSRVEWPKAQQIAAVTGWPQTGRVPVGYPIKLNMSLAKGNRASLKAEVYYQYDNGTVQRQLMNRNEDGTFTVAVDAKGQNMKVWVKAGDDQTEPRMVTVVPKLAIRQVTALVSPPAYAQQRPVSLDLSQQSTASLTVGSMVQLQVSFNKPLAAGQDAIAIEPVGEGSSPAGLVWQDMTDSSRMGTFVAMDSLRFRIRARDVDNFYNTAVEEFQLIVRPDQMPMVMIESPRRNEERTAVAVFPLEVLAEDDFGIAEMTLIVERVGGGGATTAPSAKDFRIPLKDWTPTDLNGERQRFRLKWDWDLDQMAKSQGIELKPGDVLEYYVQVRDNYAVDVLDKASGRTVRTLHEPVNSGRLRITIITQDQLIAAATEALRNASEQGKAILQSQNRTLEETRTLNKDLQDKKNMEAAEKMAANRLVDQQNTIAQRTRQVANDMATLEQRLAENKAENKSMQETAANVKEQLGRTADMPMTQAAKHLNNVSQSQEQQSGQSPKGSQGSPQQQQQQQQERQGNMQKSMERQETASKELESALNKMGEFGVMENLKKEIEAALKEQQRLSKELQEAGKETLGKRPEELSKEQKNKLDKLAADQQKAAERTQAMTGKLDKAGEQQQKSDPAGAQAAKQAAQQSRSQNVSGNQSQAAQSAQQNQQAQAQARQQAAELGLQMMLNTLREAERRKLEQLIKQLAELQEKIERLIRAQAGHNIDNLTLQVAEKLKKPDEISKTAAELMLKAEREKPLDPPNDLSKVVRLQEQTMRNARSYTADADKLPKGGAEIAAALTRSAGHMEKALGQLTENKLVEGYSPPQIDALASLENIKKQIEQAKAAAEEEQNEADRDTIRQALEKIREEQVVVNVETKRIDAAPRDDRGNRSREDDVKLGQLPGRQGGLATRTGALRDPLSSAGGVVYVWAIKDVVESMQQVQKDLGKPETGVPTQAEQNRIVEQLDAMIKNLAIKPPDPSKFAQGGGGGGGGGGSPPPERLPTEVEIRLLKALQEAVNRSTQTIAQQPKRDHAKLNELSSRQGALRGVFREMMMRAARRDVVGEKEPDAKDQLPEKASKEQVTDQEMRDALIRDNPGGDEIGIIVKLNGNRMARSRQRLGEKHDPGDTTQEIQRRIALDLDKLAEEARRQQQQQQGQPQPGQGQQGQKPQPGQGQQPANQGQPGQGPPKPNRGQSPAGQSTLSGGGDNNANPSKEIMESAKNWGALTPRERDAIIEGARETIIEKYKKLTDDYYRAMATKASERRN